MAAKKKGQETDGKSKQAIAGSDLPAGKGAPAKPAARDAGARSEGGKEGGGKKKKNGGAQLAESISSARQFLREVVIEFNKISWPTRVQVIQESYSVLFLVSIITLMVLAFDWFLGHAVFAPLEHWARLHGGGVGKG